MKDKKIAIYQIFTRLFGNKKWTNKYNGTLEENGCGKFNDINDKALYEIKKMGFTHVWYTGVIEHATMTDYTEYGIPRDNPFVVKGIAGSPYAIKDYYDVSPDLAVDVKKRMKEFEDLVKRTHEAGLRVLIDFVPNHVARRYRSDAKPKEVIDLGENDDINIEFSPNNNFYYIKNKGFEVPKAYVPPLHYSEPYKEFPAKATGSDCFKEKPYINDWFETIKINYGVDYKNCMKKHFDPIPDTWLKMNDIIMFWLGKGVDGFRCDMAEMIPIEFWEWVIPKTKEKYAKAVFIAEVYRHDDYVAFIKKGQFDYLYDKVDLYDAVRSSLEEKESVEKIKKAVISNLEYSEHMLTFMENHDEQRVASQYFAGNMFAGIPGMLISATIHKGPFMVYFGQEVGEGEELEKGFSGLDGRTTIFDYWGVTQHQNWMNEGQFDGGRLDLFQRKLRETYINIIKLGTNYDVLRKGKIKFVEFESENEKLKDSVISYVRYTFSTIVFIGANMSEHNRGTVLFKIQENNIFSKHSKVVFADILNNKNDYEVDYSSSGDLKISLYLEPHAVFAFKIVV